MESAKNIPSSWCHKPNAVFGFYNLQTKSAIPLKNISINVNIDNSIARVEYKQLYFNDQDTLLEAEYFFPISAQACFDKFEAKFSNTTVKGIIKEKEKAKEEYKENLDKGNTVAYSEINEETGDIMKVNLGNIPPLVDIEITYSYLEHVGISMNKFWKFVLYSTITPRYLSLNQRENGPSNSDLMVLSSYPSIASTSNQAYPWSIQVHLKSQSKITFLKSSSHDIIQNLSGDSKQCTISLDPSKNYVPNKDFVLLYVNEEVNKPECLTAATDEGYTAMIKFFPEFIKLSSDDAFKAQQEDRVKNIEDSVMTKGEFIFLLDRSGSMDGARIEKAKEALIFFLKSLPEGSTFDIVSFGSNSSSYASSVGSSVSLLGTEANITKALETVSSYGADLGGTEIFQPLQDIYLGEPGELPRVLFLLTDGGVSDTANVVNLIEKNASHTRVFSVGIGNGCSTQLIEEAANKGRGKFEFVGDNQDVSEKVISLLEAATIPYCEKFELTLENKDAVEYIVPDPTSIKWLLRNESCTFFVFFKRDDVAQVKNKAKLSLFDSVSLRRQEYEIEIDFDNASKGDEIVKLGIHKMVKILETKVNQSKNKSESLDIFQAKKADIQNELLNLSIKYQVLSKMTAFICVLKEGDDSTNQLPKEKILIPTIKSIDYEIKKPQLPSNVSTTTTRSKRSLAANSPNKSIPTSTPVLFSRSMVSANDKTERIQKLSRGDKLEDLMMMTNDLSSQSKSFSQKKEKSSGFLSSISNTLNSINPFSIKRKSVSKRSSDYSPESSISQQEIQTLAPSPVIESEDLKEWSNLQGEDREEENKESRSIDATETSQIPVPHSKSFVNWDENILLVIVKSQKYGGSWEFNEQNALTVRLSTSQLSSVIPESIKGKADFNDVWITVVVLNVLELYYGHKKGSWTLIQRKAVKWLEERDTDYRKFKTEVQALY